MMHQVCVCVCVVMCQSELAVSWQTVAEQQPSQLAQMVSGG